MTSSSLEPWTPSGAPERRTVHQYVHEVLRRAILSGELPGGSKLVQSEIATQLNVSTTPVREALRDLMSEGLIDFSPHRGGVVREVTRSDLEEIYDIRMALEPLSVRLAAERMTDAEFVQLEVMHQKMAETEDLGVWVDLNREFHNMHHSIAKSNRLATMVTALQDATAVYVGTAARINSELRDRALADHEKMIEAFRRRDADALETLIRAHIGIPLDYLAKEEAE